MNDSHPYHRFQSLRANFPISLPREEPSSSSSSSSLSSSSSWQSIRLKTTLSILWPSPHLYNVSCRKRVQIHEDKRTGNFPVYSHSGRRTSRSCRRIHSHLWTKIEINFAGKESGTLQAKEWKNAIRVGKLYFLWLHRFEVSVSQLGVAVHGFIAEYSRVYRSSSKRIMRKRKRDQNLRFAHEVSGLWAVD